MTAPPVGLSVAHDVYTCQVIPVPSPTQRSVVHQLCDYATACGLSIEQVPHRIAAGYAALIAADWCPTCFPAPRAA
jgi:hypothetical protein